ncbi:MAG: FGLLP motif-containing membrane protein [Acidimicrobiales bacterium]
MGLWLVSPQTGSYSFTVPTGVTEVAEYGVPAGEWLNNANGSVFIDKDRPVLIETDEGPVGSTSAKRIILWRSPALSAGHHVIHFVSYGDDFNIDGIWITDVGAPAAGGSTSSVARTLPTPHQAFASVTRDVVNAAIAGGAILFLTFPAQMFNSTLDENYEEIVAMWRSFLWKLGGKRRQARKQRNIETAPEKTTPRKRELITFAVVILVGSIIGGYRDPNFGFNLASFANLVGTIIALAVLIGAPALAAASYRKLRHKRAHFSFRAIPAGLLVALVSVYISRVTDFQPGYFYGLVCGIAFAHKLGEDEEGHVVSLESAATLIASFVAWLAFIPIDKIALKPGANVGVALVDDFLASLVVGGIVGIAIELLPLRFLPGGTLFKWNRVVWAILLAIPVFGIVGIMLNPSEGPAHQGSAPLVTVIVLFVVFGGASVAFRQFFARRRGGDDPESRVTAPTGGGQLR